MAYEGGIFTPYLPLQICEKDCILHHDLSYPSTSAQAPQIKLLPAEGYSRFRRDCATVPFIATRFKRHAAFCEMPESMHITEPIVKIGSSPLLLPNQVHLWRVDLQAVDGNENVWLQLLSPDEQSRARRFRFAVDRHRYAAVRALLRAILGSYLDRDPLQLAFLYSANGKPSLDPAKLPSGIHFNVSHSATAALLAFARNRQLGVDLELVRSNLEVESISRRFFSLHEQRQLENLAGQQQHEAFFRCWTRKEAYLKATGAGLSLPLSQFDVSILPQIKDCLLETRPDLSEASRWRIQDVPAGDGFVGALCVEGRDWTIQDWSRS